VTLILTRMKPFPTFAEVKNDLLLEELRLSATLTSAPATTLYSAPRTAPSNSRGPSSPHFGPTALWSSSPAYWLRGGGSRSRPRSQEWSRRPVGRPEQLSRWLSLALPLQPADWHHPHVARAIRECGGPSPRHLPAGLLCRFPPAAPSAPLWPQQGLLPLPRPPSPSVWGPRPMGGTPNLSLAPFSR
jgi:hypothetical protein